MQPSVPSGCVCPRVTNCGRLTRLSIKFAGRIRELVLGEYDALSCRRRESCRFSCYSSSMVTSRFSARTVIESLLLERQVHFALPPFDDFRLNVKAKNPTGLLIEIRHSPYRPISDIRSSDLSASKRPFGSVLRLDGS